MLCGFNGVIHSQILTAPKSALSPNAAGINRYGDVPVSLFTGTPEISIPLYELKIQDFTLPISLSYQASGVRVDQHPSWVGLGWSLLAGGCISRRVNQERDDYCPSPNDPESKIGFYYRYNELDNPNWNTSNYLENIVERFNYYDSNYPMPRDMAPDEFTFSFAGYSGKFYLDHKGNWIVKSDKPVKVEFSGEFLSDPFLLPGIDQKSKHFGGFTITVEDGTKYVFGGDINAIEFSVDFFYQHKIPWTADTWYLKKIILPTKQEITFTYERKEYIVQMYINVNDIMYSSTVRQKPRWGGAFGCARFTAHSSYLGPYYDGMLISPVYLKTIEDEHLRINFNTSISNELRYNDEIYENKASYLVQTGVYDFNLFPYLIGDPPTCYPVNLQKLKWYKLDNIQVVKKHGTTVIPPKSFNFVYNNNPNRRLVLNKVKEQYVGVYDFSYQNIDDLPNYLANKSDHWGFYNGTYAYVGTNDLPSNYYTYREPNATYSQYGVLNKITYPTGGYTEFVFEPHYYRQQLNVKRWELPLIEESSNRLAGGVRIKQIKNSTTATGPAKIVKEYYYVSDYLTNKTNASYSSGVLGGQFQYYFPNYTVYAFNDNTVKKVTTVFSSNSVLPACYNAAGSHVCYTEVIEKRSDNSFTRYRFTNFDNGYMDEQSDVTLRQTHTAYEPYTSKADDRGKLILQEDYDKDGKKVKSKQILYEKDKTTDNYVRALFARAFRVCDENSGIGYGEGCAYHFNIYSLRPYAEKDTIFEQNNSKIVNSIEYSYNSRKLLSKTATQGSDGKTITTKYIYPFEAASVENPTILNKMTNNHILSNYVYKIVSLDNHVVATEHLQYSEIVTNVFKTTQLDVLNNANTSKSNLYEESGTNTTVKNTMPFLKPEIIYKYNSYGNIVEIQPNGGIPKTYLWGYGGRYLMAEIQNATYDQVEKSFGYGLENLFSEKEPSNAAIIALNNLRSNVNFKNALITTYTYHPYVGLKTMTNPMGVTTCYAYSTAGYLSMVGMIEGSVNWDIVDWADLWRDSGIKIISEHEFNQTTTGTSY